MTKMLNKSRTFIVASAALLLSACGSDEDEEAGADIATPDTPIADERGQPEIAPVGLGNPPAADENGPPADTPVLAGAEPPDPAGNAAAANDPLTDPDLPYLPNCWPLHECMIED